MALATGLIAFVIVVCAYTVPDLLSGHSITDNGQPTTFFGGTHTAARKPAPTPTITNTTTHTVIRTTPAAPKPHTTSTAATTTRTRTSAASTITTTPGGTSPATSSSSQTTLTGLGFWLERSSTFPDIATSAPVATSVRTSYYLSGRDRCSEHSLRRSVKTTFGEPPEGVHTFADALS